MRTCTFKHLLASDDIGSGHNNLPVEAAWTQKRRIEHVGAVRRGNQDDAFVRFETVHLDKQLVEGLLALIVAAAEACAAMAADRIDFVDEDDARRVLLCLVEHVADTACANADEHLNEVRARDREERHIRFAGDGASEQRFTCAGRADQERAARNASAETLELLRIAQELDDLLKVLFCLVDAGHIVKGDAALLFCQQLGLRLSEAERAASARLHLAHEEDPDRDQEQHREPIHKDAKKRRDILGRWLHRDAGALGIEPLDKLRIVRSDRLESLPVVQRAADLVAGQASPTARSCFPLRSGTANNSYHSHGSCGDCSEPG